MNTSKVIVYKDRLELGSAYNIERIQADCETHTHSDLSEILEDEPLSVHVLGVMPCGYCVVKFDVVVECATDNDMVRLRLAKPRDGS